MGAIASLGWRRSVSDVVVLGVLGALIVAVPVLNLGTAADGALHMSTFTVTLLGKYLCYAMLALAVDLVWGYCGILSLGHGAFFALGGYAMGMYLMRQIGTRGVYGNPLLPDFMVFLNWKELPWYWWGFSHLPFALAMVIVVPGLLALVFGWFAFRSRVTGVYLSIITQALTYALLLAFFRNEMGFGGNNGLTDFKELLGFNLQADSTRVALFVLTATLLGLAYLGCRYVCESRYGRIVVAIRDAEDRTRFLGYRVEHFKLWIFVASAIIAGVAGALYVPQVGIINPSEFAPLSSIELVIWVAIGGRSTLYGALAGSVLVNYAKTQFTGFLPEAWLFVLGAMFVLGTLFLPYGIVGLGRREGAMNAALAPQGVVTPVTALATEEGPAALDVLHGSILYLEGITVSFDGFRALNDLSLYIERGELRCIIGPNGAGKSTMMDVVTGKTRPDAGKAFFDRNTDLLTMSEPEIAMAGIGRKFQKPTVFEQLPVLVNLELAMKADKGVWATLFARLSGEQRDRIDEVLGIVGLLECRDQRAGSLSHGQKQWLEIGMLLMQEPQLMLVDEPVAGMTHQETEKTAELLVSLAGERSVVVVEHDMEFVRSIARRVTVLHEGRVLTEGDMDTVQNDPHVIEVYLGA